MNKKIKNIVIFSLIAIGVIALAVGIYFMLLPSDKEIFSDAFKKNINNIKEIGKNDVSFFDNITDLKEDVKFKFTTDTTINYLGNETKLTGNLYSFLQEMYANMLLKNGNNETYEIEAAVKDSKLYHRVKNVYSKFYYVDLNLSTASASNSKLDSSIMLDYLEEAILEYVNNDNLVKEDKNLTLDGKEVDTTRYSLTFTEKGSLEVLKNFVSKLKNNKELYDLISKSLEDESMNIDSIISELDKMIMDADDKDKFLTYSIYLDKDIVVSNEFAISVNADDTPVTIRLTINSYKNKEGFNNFEFFVSSMGFKMLGVEVKGVSDTKSNISMYAMNVMNVNGTVESSSTAFNISLKGNMSLETDSDEVDSKEIFILEVNGKEVVKSKEYDINMNMKFNDEQTLAIVSNNKITLGEDMPEINLSNNSAIENMTEKEKEAISTILGSIFPSNEDNNEGLLS